jgi:hypothetical protein
VIIKNKIKKNYSCLALLFLSGCSFSPTVPDLVDPQKSNLQTNTTRECAAFFLDLDEAVTRAEVVDAGYLRIPGFPYLRINRFYDSFRTSLVDGAQSGRLQAWLDKLQRLDMKARGFEISTLPADEKAQLKEQFTLQGKGSLLKKVQRCGNELRKADFSQDTLDQQLVLMEFPDEYQTLKRFFGVYYLSSIFVNYGIHSLHREFREVFDTTIGQLPVKGKIQRYVPPRSTSADLLTQQQVKEILEASSDNPLSVPHPDRQSLDKLFATFAPVLEIDTQDDYDRPGRPVWAGHEQAQIDTTHPVMYTHVSHTRFEDNNLLQLVYVIWFPARPLDGFFDILGGHMDGITWRVTLGTEGRPILYDTIHNCGCYHTFFPSHNLKRKKVYGVYEEVPFVPQIIDTDLDNRIVVRVASRTHYIQKIRSEAGDAHDANAGINYSFADYNNLRSLPYREGSRKSLFSWDGIVAGTERSERWILWTMGVPEPGAMRQWGKHATAFIGKRHFDDAYLLERYFTSGMHTNSPSISR